MISHIYSNFLEDVQEYKASVRHWEELWRQVGKCELEKYQWTYPWISTGSPDILDGNPIFSAFSPVLLRGIRIIQHEPTSSKLEIQAWPDYVGGDIADPASIRELAISCALSSETARIALDLMRPWVAGSSVALSSETARIALDLMRPWVAGSSVPFGVKAGLLVPNTSSNSVESFYVPLEPAA